MIKQQACGLVVAVLSVPMLLSGCAFGEQIGTSQVTQQQDRMKTMRAEIKGFGDEAMGFINDDDIVQEFVGGASPRKVSEFFEEWPQYYVWNASIELRVNEARAPADVLRDLAVNLERVGWARSDGGVDEKYLDSLRMNFVRDGYSLMLAGDIPPFTEHRSVRLQIVSPFSNVNTGDRGTSEHDAP